MLVRGVAIDFDDKFHDIIDRNRRVVGKEVWGWVWAVGLLTSSSAQVKVVNSWAIRRKRFGVTGTKAVWCQSTTAA